MHKTKTFEQFTCDDMAAAAITPGTAAVATAFHHPSRGLVQCPAAPALAASLGRHGIAAGYAQLTARAPGPDDDDPVGRQHTAGSPGAPTWAVSYLDRDGHATGLAAAVHPGDTAAAGIARRVLREWAAVMRSRRALVTAPQPACPGVARALSTVHEALDGQASGSPLYLYGQLTASPHHARDLARRGATPVTDLDQVPDAASVVFPAHGVPLAVRAEAAARGLHVTDATCPLVTAAHAEAQRFADRGDVTIVIGRTGHAALPGILGQAPEHVLLAETAADVPNLPLTGPAGVSYLVQTGIPIEDATPVIAALRARYPPLPGPDPASWCYHASDRNAATATIAAASDLLLIAGQPGSADTRHFRALTQARGIETPVHVISDIAHLRPGQLRDAATIGLTTTLTAPPGLTSQILTVLSGLGPLTIASHHVTTQPATRQAPHTHPAFLATPGDGRQKADVHSFMADRLHAQSDTLPGSEPGYGAREQLSHRHIFHHFRIEMVSHYLFPAKGCSV